MRPTLLLLLLATPALAHPPENPPPPLDEARHYVAYDAFCPAVSGDAIERCTLYVARWPRCECPPERPDPYSCRAADVNTDDAINEADLIACSALGGKPAEACGALVQVYWGQPCE